MAKIMSMQAASLEILEQVDVPSPVARAIVQVFDIEFTEARKTLATKQDLAELRYGLEGKIQGVEARLEGKIHGVETRLEGKIQGLDPKIQGVETKLDAKIQGVETRLDAKIESRFRDLELKIERFRGDLQVDMAGMKSELIERIHTGRSDGTRHLYVALAAQTGLLFGAFYFFVTYMVK